jgi:putative sigma-54 modulation protein
MEMALRDALAAIEKQAIKHTKRKTTIKRNAKEGVRQVAVSEVDGAAVAVGAELVKAASRNGDARKAVPMLVHSFPSQSPLVEPHLVRSRDGVAMRPMTLEEAVKEAAFRDREVFVFRDHGGQAMVLHRKRDGKMELIEVP